jgi:hypothetical protein
MTNGNFIIYMACQLMLLSSLGMNMALLVEMGMTSGKLLCIVGTLFLLIFERTVVKDINSPWTLNQNFSVVIVMRKIYKVP